MTGHIGIVGCSSEGAALCYRTICAEGMARLGGHRHPEISMHTPPLQDYVEALDAGDWNRVAGLMLGSAEKLASIGAEFLICPDNTIHQAMPEVLARSPLPWLHIAEVVAGEAVRLGLRRPAVLGTRWLMEGPVYPQVLSARGLEPVIPTADDRARIDRIIMEELVPLRVVEASRAALLEIIARMSGQGADSAILGCTELPLILERGPVPLLDSTRLLATAALDRALDGTGSA